jgi:hypothetical protein
VGFANVQFLLLHAYFAHAHSYFVEYGKCQPCVRIVFYCMVQRAQHDAMRAAAIKAHRKHAAHFQPSRINFRQDLKHVDLPIDCADWRLGNY